MNKFEVILTAHSTPALPSRREGRGFNSRLNQQSKDETFAVKSRNSQYSYDGKYQKEWDKFGYSCSIITHPQSMDVFESDGFNLTPDYKFFCTLFDQMNKIVEIYKKHGVRETGGTVIGSGIFSCTLCVEEAAKLNRAKSRLYMNWSGMRREENSFYLKISLIARGFNTVFNEEVKDGKIR